MKQKFILFSLVVMALVLVACAPEAKTEEQASKEVQTPDAVVASVNGENITLGDFDRVYAFVKRDYTAAYGEEALAQSIGDRTLGDLIKEQALNSMIIDTIVDKQFAADGKTIDQAEIDANYQLFLQNNKDTDEVWKQFLADNQISEEFIKDRIEKQMIMQQFMESIRKPLMDKIDFSSAEYVDQIVQAKAKHILVETEDEAKKVYDRVKGGEDFAKVANEVSIDKASADGDLGYFTKGRMVKEFEDAAFALAVNEISQPVQTQFGYHIILLEDKKSYGDLLKTEDGKMLLENQKNMMVDAEFQEIFQTEIEKLMQENQITKDLKVIGIESSMMDKDGVQEESTTESSSK